MPRIARPSSAEAELARRLLRSYLDREHMSVNALAKRVGLVQSTVQRFLSGRTKEVTPRVAKVLAYANIELKHGIIGSEAYPGNKRLRRALEHALDAHPQAIDLLTTVIEGIAVALQGKPVIGAQKRWPR